MAEVLVTKAVFDKLASDVQAIQMKEEALADPHSMFSEPTAMIVFDGGDLNAATYHLAQALGTVIGITGLKTVLVQESIRGEFIEMLQNKLEILSAKQREDPRFASAIAIIGKLCGEVVSPPGAPVIVSDLTNEQLNGGAPNVATLHTFRTAKEAITLHGKETINFVNTSIWNEKYACAYELVPALRCNNFFVNCYNVPLKPIKEHIANQHNFVVITSTYHYETVQLDGIQKSIVFPMGTIFAN